MTHDIHNDNNSLPDALRWELRALRRDAEPATDLWPSIAQRIAATPQASKSPRVERPAWRRFVPLATAASLALALGIAWQLRPIDMPTTTPPANDPHAQLIAKEAEVMTLEYQAALKELVAGRPPQTLPSAPALKVLDRSAAQIRTALTRDPNARFLLDRLQHTYNRRLQITQRLATRSDSLAS